MGIRVTLVVSIWGYQSSRYSIPRRRKSCKGTEGKTSSIIRTTSSSAIRAQTGAKADHAHAVASATVHHGWFPDSTGADELIRILDSQIAR